MTNATTWTQAYRALGAWGWPGSPERAQIVLSAAQAVMQLACSPRARVLEERIRITHTHPLRMTTPAQDRHAARVSAWND